MYSQEFTTQSNPVSQNQNERTNERKEKKRKEKKRKECLIIFKMIQRKYRWKQHKVLNCLAFRQNLQAVAMRKKKNKSKEDDKICKQDY
jgi:NADH:ubiquinone oxidoreductase subunit E